MDPGDDDDCTRDESAIAKFAGRADIAIAMRQQAYTQDTTAPETTLRFLAAPADVNWGGKTHGGTVMRWIDQAAYVCASGWSSTRAVAASFGEIHFHRPILIGHIVEVRARLLHTGRSSMHILVHVSSGDPKSPEMKLATHCMTVSVAVDENNRPSTIRRWEPTLAQDRTLENHAQQLIRLRSG